MEVWEEALHRIVELGRRGYLVLVDWVDKGQGRVGGVRSVWPNQIFAVGFEMSALTQRKKGSQKKEG